MHCIIVFLNKIAIYNYFSHFIGGCNLAVAPCMYFLNGGRGCLKSDIPVIDDFRFGKTVNEPKTLGTTGI